jgi:hypothetical protein
VRPPYRARAPDRGSRIRSASSGRARCADGDDCSRSATLRSECTLCTRHAVSVVAIVALVELAVTVARGCLTRTPLEFDVDDRGSRRAQRRAGNADRGGAADHARPVVGVARGQRDLDDHRARWRRDDRCRGEGRYTRELLARHRSPFHEQLVPGGTYRLRVHLKTGEDVTGR